MSSSNFASGPWVCAMRSVSKRFVVAVDLDGDDRGAGVQQPFGEGAGARAHFEHAVAGANGRGLHDPGHVVAVVQVVLPELVLGVEAVGGEQLLDVGEGLGHGGGIVDGVRVRR